MLVILSGLPATGKTTVARLVAPELGALYLRVDTIEQELINSGFVPEQFALGALGYKVAYAIAADNLRLGHTVLADSVNPVDITREAWRKVAASYALPYLEVEFVCSDKAEHRKRVEGRTADIIGQKLPSWADVEAREYHPWSRDIMRIDTALLPAESAAALIIKAARECCVL